jgi:hypothetical protein
MAEERFTEAVTACGEPAMDAIWRKGTQLRALLRSVYGEAFESFDAQAEDVKNDFFWACADMAHDISRLAELAQQADIARAQRTKNPLSTGEQRLLAAFGKVLPADREFILSYAEDAAQNPAAVE